MKWPNQTLKDSIYRKIQANQSRVIRCDNGAENLKVQKRIMSKDWKLSTSRVQHTSRATPPKKTAK